MVIRVGFVGAGYIAEWHAEALAAAGARLVAVADPALAAAEGLAAAWRARAYPSIEAMLAAGGIDAVHILTPPHLHCAHALKALDAGLHVLVEKPFAVSRAEAEAMVLAADRAGKVIGVNHNFLALPAYQRLKSAMAEGTVAGIDSIDIRWRFPLAPLRSGPFGLWMLRDPANLLLELGPHLFAFAADLVGPLSDVDLRLSKPITLPSGVTQHQGWHIRAKAGAVDVVLNLSLVEGAEDRSVEVRGVNAVARLDYGNDVLIIDRPNASDIVVNPLRAQLALAGQHLREGGRNAVRQLVSLNRKSPYGLGFRGSIRSFYAAVAGGALEARFSGASAVGVIAGIEAALAHLPAPVVQAPEPRNLGLAHELVIGGTGFIGRALVRALVASGRRVRVLSRGRANPFADLGDGVEMVAASLADPAALRTAMEGMRCVYHLAKAEESSWEAYLQNDVAVVERVAEAALAAGVERFVYAGTIASYDASDASTPITEATPFGPMENRNLYARSKALCEERLQVMHRTRGLPLVIARPGIVVGEGGPLQHWGIGRWHGAGAVRIWGNGRNILPFVLIDDVADALVRMADAPDIEGQSFNLVGEPLLSAQGYFAAIRRLTGVQIRVSRGNLHLFHVADTVKYLLKRFALRKRGLRKPLLTDWKSRAHLSPFQNDKAKAVLGWQPESVPQAFEARAISYKGFFGF
jgi:predicted dehydrogenase/nucleoside-diphosphate-sugar epimerase